MKTRDKIKIVSAVNGIGSSSRQKEVCNRTQRALWCMCCLEGRERVIDAIAALHFNEEQWDKLIKNFSRINFGLESGKEHAALLHGLAELPEDKWLFSGIYSQIFPPKMCARERVVLLNAFKNAESAEVVKGYAEIVREQDSLDDRLCILNALAGLSKHLSDKQIKDTVSHARWDLKPEMTAEEKVMVLYKQVFRYSIAEFQDLFTDQMTLSDKIIIMNAALVLPKHELSEILRRSCQLISEEMSAQERANILLAFLTIDPKEYWDVSRYASQLIREDMNADERIRILQAVASIPVDNRYDVVSHAVELIHEGMGARDRLRILSFVNNIDTDLREFVQFAAVMIHERMTTEDRLHILSAVKEIWQGNHWHLKYRLQELIREDMSAEDGICILRAVIAIPEDDQTSIVMYVKRLTCDDMSGEAIRLLIEAVSSINSDQRGISIDTAVQLIQENMNVEDRIRILQRVADIPNNLHRPRIIHQVQAFLREGMSADDVLALLQAVQEFPSEHLRRIGRFIETPETLSANEIVEQLNNLVAIIESEEAARRTRERMGPINTLVQLIGENMSVEDRMRVLQRVSEISDRVRSRIIRQVQAFLTEEMSADDVLALLEAVQEFPARHLPRIREFIETPETLSVNEIIESLQNLRAIIEAEDEFSGIADSVVLIDPSKIQDDLTSVLRELLPKMKRGVMPKIKYEDSEGIDAGGLTRDFVTKVFMSVCENLPMEDNDGKLTPLMEDASEDQLTSFKAVGAFFAYAINGVKQVTTGSNFDSRFFQMLYSLAQEDVCDAKNYADIPEETSNKLFRIFARTHLSGNHFQLSEEEISSIIDGNVPQRLKELLGYESKEEFFTDNFKKMALACVTIHGSLLTHLIQADSWNAQKGASPEALAKKVQGAVTREGVQNALRWTGQNHDATKGYLERWIGECSEEDLVQFVWAATGSRGLGAGTGIKINIYDEQQKLPVFHTCFFTMDLPNGYPNYDVFLSKLNESLRASIAQGGFQMG